MENKWQMTKAALLTILNNSILRNDVSMRELYAKYYPLVERCLREVEKPGVSPKEFSSKTQWDIFLRASDAAAIEIKLKELLRQLHLQAVRTSAENIPTGEEQARMRERAIQTILSAATHCPSSQERKALEDAALVLRGIVFPKRDRRVISCYLAIMEAADDFFAGTWAEPPAVRIAAAADAWKSLARG